jgi:hypothetical protein
MKQFRRGTPGKYPPLRIIKQALKLIEERKRNLANGEKFSSYRSIAHQLGIFSPSTIQNYEHKDMSLNGINERLKKKVNFLFSEEIESIISGWLVYRDLCHLSTTSTIFIEFIKNHFKVNPSPTFIHNFCKRHQFSFKLPSPSKEIELTSFSMETAINFLKKVELLKKHEYQIIVIDKTSLFNPVHKFTKHICPKGRSKPRRVCPLRGTAHVVYTGLKGDGTILPFYVESTKYLGNIFNDESYGYINTIAKNKTRRGEESAMEYIIFLHSHGLIRGDDLLLFDGEKCFSTEKMEFLLFRMRVMSLVIQPPVLHQLLSPCDNYFHGLFKLNYYRKISNLSSSLISIKTQLQIAAECYHSISRETVRNMFSKCGLLGGNKKNIVLDLINDGIHYSKHKDIQLQNLQIFFKWIRLQKKYCGDNTQF